MVYLESPKTQAPNIKLKKINLKFKECGYRIELSWMEFTEATTTKQNKN